MFVWTVQGILDAIMLGIIGLFLLLIGSFFLIEWVSEKWKVWRKK